MGCASGTLRKRPATLDSSNFEDEPTVVKPTLFRTKTRVVYDDKCSHDSGSRDNNDLSTHNFVNDDNDDVHITTKSEKQTSVKVKPRLYRTKTQAVDDEERHNESSSSNIEGSSDHMDANGIHEEKTNNKAKADIMKGDTSNASGVYVNKRKSFSMERPEDKEIIKFGYVLVLSGKVIFTDPQNKRFKLFSKDGEFISSSDSVVHTMGMTRISANRFATCWRCKILIWEVQGDTIRRVENVYKVDNVAYNIHYNGTYFNVLHRRENAISVLDCKGRQIRKITVHKAFGRKMTFGWDIHSDSRTHNIYMPCWSPAGVLCVSLNVQVLWFTELPANPWGISEIGNFLCVISGDKSNMLMVSKSGKMKANSSRAKYLVDAGIPQFIDALGNLVTISYCNCSFISVWSIA